MDKLIQKCLNALIDHGAASQDDREILEYGLEVAFFTGISIVSMLLLGAIVGMFVETLLYTVLMLPLRAASGGYHASSRIRCFLISAIGCALSLATARYVSSYALVLVILALCASIYILRFAPILHVNNPLSAEQKTRMRKVAILTTLLELAAVVLFAVLGMPQFASALALLACSLSTVAVLLFTARKSGTQNYL